jgi:phospholipase C
VALENINHFFLLVLENRSFDHLLGFSGIASDHLLSSPIPAGYPGAWQSPNFGARQGADYAVSPDPPHEFQNIMHQLTGKPPAAWPGNGCPYPPINLSGFVASYEANPPQGAALNPQAVMSCFQSGQLAVIQELAQTFGVADQWFSSLPGPTWPNRLFIHAGTSGGLDHSPGSTETVKLEFLSGFKFQSPHLFEILDRAHPAPLKWRIYHGDCLPQVLSLSDLIHITAPGEHFRPFDQFAKDVADPSFDCSYIFIEPNYGHDLTSDPTKDSLDGNSMHPVSDVRDGETLIKNVYEALRQSPIWKESALILLWDEHGGFFDHCVPPATVPPDGDRTYANTNFAFTQLGVRVPALVISPYTPPGSVLSALCDHSAFIKLLCKRFSLPEPTARVRWTGDLSPLFSLDTPRDADAPMSLPDPRSLESRLAGQLGAMLARIRGEPDPKAELTSPLRGSLGTSGGALSLAATVDAQIGGEAAEPAIQARLAAIRTGEDARDYIREVQGRIAAHFQRTP